ncbi:SpaA isopeptide-forming pilin-related protein [Enterococcus hulanensis]|uniref:SpaA isopeptide-forming pilin-related protein n=1 Tax=Enterococcus hulanensis TaxID=2559929 RepID=UPI00288D42F7|nr:SpaA isopeptide-forming pilin-related protein [Enterococcus hulanensis]MDT2659415.1 SpaA isopeptide-forming pilin-related protein [Enterococcus hulanensis]
MKADDQNAHLVDVKVNGKKIDDNYSVTEQGTLLEMSAKEPQLLKFLESDKYKVELLNEKGEPLPSEKLSNEKLTHFQGLVESIQKSNESTEKTDQTSSSTTETSTPPETEEIVSQLFYVVEDEKQVPYLLLDKEETIWLSVTNKKPEEATNVVLEVPNADKKQSLINFKPKKDETTETSKKEEKASSSSENKESTKNTEKQEQATSKSSASNNEKSTTSSIKKEETSSSKEKETTKKSATKTKATKLTKEEKKRNLAIEQLLDEKYEEKDSFKPIELPAEGASSRETKSGSTPISVTGAKMTIKDGTAGFDLGNDNPGYDSGDNNGLVRSFDSILYLLTFSVEASDPTTTYSEIKYSVDMELSNAYDLDSSGKQRFNAEVVSDNSDFGGNDTDTTRASIGSVESTISANGQILLPMFVNVYGAQHGTNIKPNMKITIISAKNNKTGETEEIDHTYDQSDLSALELATTKVSAKASITATISKGGVKPLSDVVDGGANSSSAFGVGVVFGLKPISGRTPADFRGSTFPNGEIKAGFHSRSYYKSNGAAAGNGEAISTYALRAIASSVATTESTGWDKIAYSSQNFNISDAVLPLFVPNGKTRKIYSSEPTMSTEDKKKIGVYDTGNIAVTNPGATISLSNTDYEPIYNPYTYRLTGMQFGSNEKVFSSSMMIVEWNREYLINKGTGVLTTELNLTSLRYEGQTYDEAQTISVSDGTLPSGAYVSAPVWVKNTAGSHPYTNLGSYPDWSESAGDATVGQGESNVLFGGVSAATDGDWIISIFRWNANSFEYDMDREVWGQYERYGNFLRDELRYGVGKTRDYPTPEPSPTSKSVASKNELEEQYDWYRTPDEAVVYGKISAVKVVNQKPRGQTLLTWNGVPLKVIGITGDRDQFGHSTAGYLNTYWSDTKENVMGQFPFANTSFTASTYDSLGNKLVTQSGRHIDSIFIKPFKIETTTTPDKPVYKTTEDVKWKVKGNILTTSDTEYGVRLTTTLPKGLVYESNSSTDGNGTQLPDPMQVDKGNGVTDLIWNFSNINPSQGNSVEVNFVSKPVLKDLTFNDASLSDVTAKTVGEIWLQSNPSMKDTSAEYLRTSYGKVQLYQMQQIVLTKELDKSLIEVGDNDPANPSAFNDITYKVTLLNNSSDKLVNAKVIDELPYDADVLQTDFDGSYTVKNIKITEGDGEITYTNDPVHPDKRDDPNKNLGTWSSYVPGTSNSALIKNAKGFVVTSKELAVGDSLVFEVTISPNGQKAGNILRNRAAFNSHLNLPVKSNIVQTQVLGRDLTGYVWYDDDYKGLIDPGEEPVGDIPVKLYRTSLVNGTYVKQLVERSLTGEEFIDSSGNSKIKTEATGSDKGKYKFENLPEGEYIAEFIVGDIVVTRKVAIVTKQLQGTGEYDPLNSKADEADPFRTPEKNEAGDPFYVHPELKDLPAILTGTDKVQHITDVNAGLTRLSKIRLFKYEEGTVVDTNGNGKLDPEEIEASTTNALEGAEFQLYKGKSDNPNTIKDENKVGTVKVTGSDGWLEFESLPPGFYTIVETKAPAGFELLKKPIEVEVPTYNYIAIVHVPDSAQTKLPFTGSTKAMRIILIAAAVLMVVGMTGVFLHFRPINVKGGK